MGSSEPLVRKRKTAQRLFVLDMVLSRKRRHSMSSDDKTIMSHVKVRIRAGQMPTRKKSSQSQTLRRSSPTGAASGDEKHYVTSLASGDLSPLEACEKITTPVPSRAPRFRTAPSPRCAKGPPRKNMQWRNRLLKRSACQWVRPERVVRLRPLHTCPQSG